MKCPNCNQMLPDDSAFCQYCGESINRENEIGDDSVTEQGECVNKRENEIAAIIAELYSLREESERIVCTPSLVDIEGFIDYVKSLNSRIKASDLDTENSINARESLGNIARKTAKELYSRIDVALAHRIVSAIKDEFVDMPLLYSKLCSDEKKYQMLPDRSEINYSALRNTGKRKRSNPKSIRVLTYVMGGICIVIVFALLVGILTSVGTTSNRNTYVNSQSNNVETDTSSYSVTLNQNGGTGGTPIVTVKNGNAMPEATAPVKIGYVFKGYYSNNDGSGTEYYDSEMRSTHNWDESNNGTIYAYWEEKHEEAYSLSASLGDLVYVDIISIFPEIGIYSKGEYDYSSFVCKCKTNSGDTVWVHMTCDQYKNCFDSSVNTSVILSSAEEISFKPSKRIHGSMIDADVIMDGLSDNTGEKIVSFLYLR